MTESDNLFGGSIPRLYDTHMIPLSFEAYAAGTAELVAGLSLGLSSKQPGSGVITRALATRLCAGARYWVTGIN